MAGSLTLYLDSSGDPGWTPPFGKSITTWYIAGGIALTPEADQKAGIEVQRILKKYIPETQRRKFPPREYEIHYHKIVGGHDIFDHMDHSARKAMSDEVFTLIKSLNPVLFATAINKTQLKRVYGGRAYHPKALAIQATIGRFSFYLERENKIGSIMMDEEEYRKDKELQSLVHTFRRDGIMIRGTNYQPMYENTLTNVLNAPSFTPSHISPGIQLADVISRCTWTHFERQKSNRFNELQSLWDSGDRVFEPSVVPARNRWI